MRKIMPLLLVAVAVVAGCSSGSSTTSAAAPGASAAPVSLPGAVTDHGTGDATSGKLTLELDDFYFNPTFLKVAPGEKLTLTLKNEGKVAHTFTSAALGVDQTIDPGKQVDVDVAVPATVPVEFHCRFHQASGMQGALFAQSGATAVPATSAASTAPATSSDPGYYN